MSERRTSDPPGETNPVGSQLTMFFWTDPLASCESFMKALKREEIYANTYRDLDHLRANIAAFIEQYYNRCRLHSALGYSSPEAFELAASSAIPAPGATMRFFRPRALARAASSAGDEAEATEAM